MNRSVRRRLDVIIALCSGLLGIVLAYLFFSQRTGVTFVLYALFPTVLLVLLAFLYVHASRTADAGSRSES